MTYAGAGVDIDKGDRAVGLIERHLRRTYSPRVLGKHGAFAGMFRLDYNERLFKRNYRDPVLVSCTDSVGTKVMLAAQLGVHDTIGQDCVAMNVNDLIVQGAEPLFFVDYIGIHQDIPQRVAQIVFSTSSSMEDVTAEFPILALILTRKALPIIIGSDSGWLILAGMIARPSATSLRTKSASILSRRATNSISGVMSPRRA